MFGPRVTLPAARNARPIKTAPLVFPSSSFPGARGQEGAGRLINCYAEPLGPGARGQFSRRRVPGLTGFATSDQTTFRGMIESAGVLYAGFDGKCYKTTSAGGAMTLVGNLAGDGKLFVARNNNTTPDVVVVDPGEGAFVLTATSVAAYPDADVLVPNSVCLFYGYFVFGYGDGKLRASGINTTAINSLDFVLAEGKPDAVLCPVPLGDVLYVFGSYSIELWSGTNINVEGFPFTRLGVLPIGLKGRYTVTGHEDGCGMRQLFFVGADSSCYLISGASYEKISPPDLERLIEDVADADTLEAGTYVAQGRTVVALSGPDWTWEYTVGANKWTERKSHSLDRWRGTQPRYVFSKWLCGDTQSGNIVEIRADENEEIDDPLTMTMVSAPIAVQGVIARVDLDVTGGVGETSGATTNLTDPVCEISVSLDGGATFGLPQQVPLGQMANYRQYVFATRFGRTAGIGAAVKVEISDPVDVGLIGGAVTVAA